MKHLHCPEVESFDAPALGLKDTEKMEIRVLSDNSVQIELGPGGYTPDHIHDDKERLVIISGKGIIKLGEERIEIQPNDFVEIDHEKHQVINTGSKPLIFMGFRNQL